MCYVTNMENRTKCFPCRSQGCTFNRTKGKKFPPCPTQEPTQNPEDDPRVAADIAPYLAVLEREALRHHTSPAVLCRQSAFLPASSEQPRTPRDPSRTPFEVSAHMELDEPSQPIAPPSPLVPRRTSSRVEPSSSTENPGRTPYGPAPFAAPATSASNPFMGTPTSRMSAPFPARTAPVPPLHQAFSPNQASPYAGSPGFLGAPYAPPPVDDASRFAATYRALDLNFLLQIFNSGRGTPLQRMLMAQELESRGLPLDPSMGPSPIP